MSRSVRERIGAIGQELSRLESAAPPAERERLRRLMHELLEAHLAGLARIVEVIGADATARLGADPEIAALLMLHGLHPVPLRERVDKAVANLAPRVAAQHATLTLVSLSNEGCVTVRVEHAGKRGALHDVIEEAFAAAAADATEVQIEEVITMPLKFERAARKAAG